ncbi:MAG: AAA family ATPase [Mycobacterium sp.]
MLYGRERECTQIDRLLVAARERRSQALVVRGEPGIGKSALLGYAAEQASGLQILRTAGIQTESQLPFAAVHNLLLAVLDRAEAIPERQRAALLSAFGLGPGAGEDRFLISLAVLSVLAEIAETAPLLCLVDDAQWLDEPSADALTFAARRVQAEGIVILFAARDDPTKPFVAQGLPELRMAGVGPSAAAALLAEHTGVPVAASVRDRLVADSLGNPLALAESARSLSAAQIAGRAPLPDQLPVGNDLERLFLDRAAQLPPDTRTMLLVAAAHDTGQLDAVLRAAEVLGVEAAALDAAETAGLLRIDSAVVSFVHPLVRSAVYRGATTARRQDVERALADVLDAAVDADRKAWHLAKAAAGPDPEVADALHAAAERARARGGHAAAAAAFDRAAGLTTEPELVAARLAEAANAAWSAGQPDRARALLDQAAALAGAPALRARVEHLRGSIEGDCGTPSAAYAILVAGSELVMSADPARAAQMLSDAGLFAWAGGDLARLSDVSRRFEELPGSLDAGFVGAHVIVGLSGVLRGDTSSTAARLRQAADLAGASKEPRALTGAAAGAMFVGDDARAIDLFCTAVALTRTAAEAAHLPRMLAPLAMVETLTSRYPAALADATEGLRLAEETGQLNPAAHLRSILALIAAVQGRAQDCRDHATAALTQAIGQRLGPHAAIASWALALLDLGTGRAHEAFDRLEALAGAGPGEGNQIVMLMATADLVEAAARTQHQAAAAAGTEKLQGWATDTGAPWANALAARCHGLLGVDSASPDDQDRHFAEALRLHARVGRPFDMARTQLLYGESLRRRRRRADARRYLRSAYETFERLGATPWAEQASAELLATGETARKRDVSTTDQLTPQELQIARFVSRGETNRSIATLMFLSPRTVDYHLRKIFTKLGLTSRAELIRMALSDDGLAGR